MSHYSLFPASLRINYQSEFGIHSMTIPTAKFAFDSGVYKFLKEDLTFIGQVDTLVTAYVNAIKSWFYTGVTFIDFQAFTYDTPTSAALPLFSANLGIAGTAVAGTNVQRKATQATWTWRTNESGIFKLVFLDTSLGSFEKITNAANASVAPIHAIVAGANTWMRGRDGGLPVTFLQVAFTLNEKLRKAYRMN